MIVSVKLDREMRASTTTSHEHELERGDDGSTKLTMSGVTQAQTIS